VEVVKLLLNHPDIDPNFKAASGYTALMCAVRPYADVRVVRLLLGHEGTNVNQRNDRGRTALHVAAYSGALKAAELLLEREDIDINLPDNNGWTPLFYACSSTPWIAKLLLDHPDIDVNRQNGEGRTALCHVISRNNLKAAKLLLEREDLDINRPDNNGYTALFWACNIDYDVYRVGSSVAIVRSLLSHRDTDPNAINDNGDSVFAHFMRHRCLIDSHEAGEIEFLLKKAGSRPTSLPYQKVKVLSY
jgi:ankyrin repeat protein